MDLFGKIHSDWLSSRKLWTYKSTIFGIVDIHMLSLGIVDIHMLSLGIVDMHMLSLGIVDYNVHNWGTMFNKNVDYATLYKQGHTTGLVILINSTEDVKKLSNASRLSDHLNTTITLVV